MEEKEESTCRAQSGQTEEERVSYTTQYFSAFSACLLALAVGSAIGFSSPATLAFRCLNSTDDGANDTRWGDLCLSEEERGWFSGTLSLGALVGCMLAGFCINSIGRKGTMLLSLVPLTAGWVFIGLAQNLALLLCGRVLCGLTVGISSLVVPTYTTECASDNIRGALGSGFQLFVTAGILYAYFLGALMEWRWLVLACILLGPVFLLLALFLKESPTYLLAKGTDKQAKNVLQYLRGKSYNVDKELEELKRSLEESRQTKVTLKELTTPYILKPLLITLALMVFQQLAGVNAVIYNISVIFQDSGSDVSEEASIIIVGIVQVLATATSAFLIDRAGRKVLLSLSAGVMCISIGSLGLFFLKKSQDEEWTESTLGWLPLTSLMIFISSFSIGYGPIPWLMMGELFQPNVKEAAGSLATTLNWSCVFVVTFTFEPLQDALQEYGVYFLFSALCALNFIFCLTMVPETKGKTLQETAAYFGRPSPSSSQPTST